jgi:hypothetical protein
MLLAHVCWAVRCMRCKIDDGWISLLTIVNYVYQSFRTVYLDGI